MQIFDHKNSVMLNLLAFHVILVAILLCVFGSIVSVIVQHDNYMNTVHHTVYTMHDNGSVTSEYVP